VYKHVLRAGQAGYPINSIKSLVNRVRFLFRAFIYRKTLKTFIKKIDVMGYSELFSHETPLLVLAYCPYIHNQWGVQERFNVILGHYKIIKAMPDILNLVDGKPKVILDLTPYSLGTFITLDKAKWFVREGEVVLNLFKEDQRLMSLAFTFSKLNDAFVIYIGAIQGRQSSAETLSMIKEVTKCFEGLRPADFLLEILRIIAANIGANKILAISDEHRHHRHEHFTKLQLSMLKTNYNEKWIENQGILLNNGFYTLPIKKSRRDLAEVASNKRAAYRRRYDMLDKIEVDIKQLLNSVETKPVELAAAFPITTQQKEIDLNPESSALAKAMYDIANNQILLGDMNSAKKTLRRLIKEHPNAELIANAKKRLDAMEVVKALESIGTIKHKH
jgi:uncharacterized protein VirK/YbjX